MTLSQASVGVRKAAWLKGIKNQNAEWRPVFGGRYENNRVVGIVDERTEIFFLDVHYANQLTWKEIKERS